MLAYTDDAEAVMPPEPRPVRITEIRLRPRVTVAPGTDPARVEHLLGVAHRECYVANALACAMTITPTVAVA